MHWPAACQVHKPVVNIKNFLETVKHVGSVQKTGLDGGSDWLGREDDDDDDDEEEGAGPGRFGAGLGARLSRQVTPPPAKGKVKAPPMVGDDEDGDEAKERGSGDMLGALPDGLRNDNGQVVRGSGSGRGQAELPHSTSPDMEDVDGPGGKVGLQQRRKYNGDSARASGDYGPNGAPTLVGKGSKPVAPAAAAATGRARRASFQLAEDTGDDDDKPHRRMGSPKGGRKSAEGPAAAGAGAGPLVVAAAAPAPAATGGYPESDKSSESGVSASDISASVSQAGGGAAAGATGWVRRPKTGCVLVRWSADAAPACLLWFECVGLR